jgi:hypothetical protein
MAAITPYQPLLLCAGPGWGLQAGGKVLGRTGYHPLRLSHQIPGGRDRISEKSEFNPKDCLPVSVRLSNFDGVGQ